MSNQKTKEELVKENTLLEQKLSERGKEDLRIRTELSELLDSYTETTDRFGGGGVERKINVQSWLGIAFLIGELKADANYSMVLEAKENFRQRAAELEKENYLLKNPSKKRPAPGPEEMIRMFGERL